MFAEFLARYPEYAATASLDQLRALCESCEAIMHRRVREADIAKVMPDCTVQFAEGRASLSGQIDPSLDCDSERRG